MTFEEYLRSKKIDSAAYKAGDYDQWMSFNAIFGEMHPKSFTMQKLNLINGIRRRFPYKEQTKQEQTKPKVNRPITKPKIRATSDTPKKPVVKPKISADKPKMSKPVMKPKVNKPVMKPKVARPVIKPKITAEEAEEKKAKSVMKPKMVRPVIKPKNKD